MVQGNLLSWIEADGWIEKKQRVVLNDHCSTWSYTVGGVPQGSVLCLCLLCQWHTWCCKQSYLTFCWWHQDFWCIKTHHDYIQLQSDLNYLSEWSLTWKLKFNISKYNDLHLRTSHQHHTYYICGTVIQSVLSVRDLGVMIGEDLKFHEHTSFVTTKAFLCWLKEVLPVWTLTCWFIFIILWCDLYISAQI